MKVGIIGCGKIAQVRHIPEYLENPDVEIVGYYDWNADRAAELAAQFGGKAYSTEDELLADKEMDAVSVCVANNAHAKVTIKALNAGKHVLCEKPMAVTLEECMDMVKAADENGKYLMIGQNQRFAKAHSDMAVRRHGELTVRRTHGFLTNRVPLWEQWQTLGFIRRI